MSGLIPKHFIEDLIARVDLVELIGSRLPLKKYGKEYKACCPFHGEKTPSFTVVPDKQFFHCFGCGEHGNALGFLMKHDNLGFVEAVEELADRVGVEIPREQGQAQRPPPSDALFATLDRAAGFYSEQLQESERGRAYFKARGLTGATATKFRLGYAPDAWDAVLKRFGGSEADRQRLQQVGLVIERDNRSGHYDRFRDRVMFPIRDARGRTIGFGGRVLDKGEPKYMNSPETELFHKGRELYGLYEARQATRTLSKLLIVEGYMDVVRLHQAGITYAVATLGTATTPEHLARVFRICNEVIFCFDGDRAGRAAAWKALESSLSQVREGRQLRFMFLPDGHDPDSLVGAEGPEAFEARLEHADEFSKYFMSQLTAQVDRTTAEGRAQMIELARPLLDRMPAGNYSDMLREKVAKLTIQIDTGLVAAFNQQRESAQRRPSESDSASQWSGSGSTAGLRQNLIRQSIHLLVHYPQIADKVQLPAGVATLLRPGIALLVELLKELQQKPCATTGILLERWRDHPDIRHLSKLARMECVPDAGGAAKDLAGALQQLGEHAASGRREYLLSKHGREGLSDAEKAELQGLLGRRPPVDHGA